jgi:phosphoglycolate phosphatase
MNRYKNILFDLDGTLLDTKSGVLGSVKKAFADLSIALPPEEELENFMGPPLEQCFTEVCKLSLEQAYKAMSVYRRYYEDSGIFDARPYEGIMELLANLRGKGYCLGVATSKSQRLACAVLEHFDLDGYFETIAGAPEGTQTLWSKKDSVLKAMSALTAASAANTVLVGDRKYDAKGADDAGIDAIGVLFGYGKIDEIEASRFKMIAADIPQLQKLLLR